MLEQENLWAITKGDMILVHKEGLIAKDIPVFPDKKSAFKFLKERNLTSKNFKAVKIVVLPVED